MNFTCRICGQTDHDRVYQVREMMYGTRERFDYFECDSCGTLQIIEIPTDPERFYPADYLSFDDEVPIARTFTRRTAARLTGEYLRTGKGFVGKMIEGQFPGLVGHYSPSLHGLPRAIGRDARILDVGCGNGSFLRTLHYFGFRSLTGIDAFIADDISYPSGVKVFKRRIEDVEPEFDLIMLHHSFEHMPDPHGAMENVARLLAEGGQCIVRIPVLNFAWEKYGVNWVQLDAPRHFFLFTEQGFADLAGRSGLVVEKTIYDSWAFQFWGSEQYLLDIPLTDPRSYWKAPERSAFTARQIVDWRNEAEKLNAEGRGDMACFYLRRA